MRESDCQRGRERRGEGGRKIRVRWTGFELIVKDCNGEVITKLQTKTAHEWVSLSPGTHPYSGGQEVVRAE